MSSELKISPRLFRGRRDAPPKERPCGLERAGYSEAHIRVLESAMPSLTALYSRVDAGYETHLREHNLSCGPCLEAPCCRVDLRLHTYLEKYHLLQGFASLDADVRAHVLALCVHDGSVRIEDRSCVFRGDGLCLIYPWRPLICRLAGPSHSFQSPRGGRVEGDGCPQLMRVSAREAPPPMDRTLFYKDMSRLELDMVNEFGARSSASAVSGTILEAFGRR